MVQTQENVEKPHFGTNLGPLNPSSGRQIFFQNSGFVSHYISWSAHHAQYQKNIMIQS